MKSEFRGVMVTCPVKEREVFVDSSKVSFRLRAVQDHVEFKGFEVYAEFACKCGVTDGGGSLVTHRVLVHTVEAVPRGTVRGMEVYRADLLTMAEMEQVKTALLKRKEAFPEPERHTVEEGYLEPPPDEGPEPERLHDGMHNNAN